MKLSFDWLSDFVDLTGISPHELADKLTMGAFEVEEVHKVGSAVEGPIVIGEILEIYAHPNADKIRLTKTRVEPGAQPLEIVCGASNIEVGQRIPVALVGARVLDRKEGKPYELIAKPVRGVVSNGMLCSPAELGLSIAAGGIGAEATDPAGGILIFDSDDSHYPIGKDVIEMLGLKPDYILQVEPRSNRGDALSVVGLAREVAALLQRPLKSPAWQVPDADASAGSPEFHVSIENPEDCGIFTIRIISNVQAGQLPPSMLRRLEAVGVRSVNSIVDITNYVMHELGQPLHAYDLAKVNGDSLTVRKAKANETIETIDGKKRQLTDEVLVIADSQSVCGVAGVMGGKESEISDSTDSIALEAAAFAPARVRRSSRLLGLSSDSSLRFERGVDACSSIEASNRAAYLIWQYCGKDNARPELGPLVTAGSDKIEPVTVALRLNQITRILSFPLTAEQVTSLLTPLGFVVTRADSNQLTVAVPSFRQRDVSREIDIVEEVCRLWGYDKVPATMPASTIAANTPDSTLTTVIRILAGSGLSEAWVSSLTNEQMVFGSDGSAADHSVRVLNPLSADHQVLRKSLLPGLVQTAAYNVARGAERVWLFEIGRTYEQCPDSPAGTGVIEPTRVGAVLLGHARKGWTSEESATLDFYTAKGIVENLLDNLGIDLEKVRFFKSDEPNTLLHPAKSCRVAFAGRGAKEKVESNRRPIVKETDGQKQPYDPNRNLQLLGWLGEIHPAMADKQGLGSPAYLFELDLDLLKPLRKVNTFKETANTPSVKRDLTVDVAEVVDYAVVHSCITADAGKNLQELELVSTFKPSEGQKSLSFRLRLQDPEKTLTNEEVDALLLRLRKTLTARVGATFRT
jgi:phenylalanyl-tRNA synthetase beta chain